MKKLFLSIVVFCFSFLANCQLDSVNVDVIFELPVNVVYEDSNAQVMKVKVWVNDIDFLGELIIDVLDTETESPLAKVKLSKQEILNQNLLENNWIIILVGVLDSSQNYSVKTLVRNFQYLDLPQVTTLYSNSN